MGNLLEEGLWKWDKAMLGGMLQPHAFLFGAFSHCGIKLQKSPYFEKKKSNVTILRE